MNTTTRRVVAIFVTVAGVAACGPAGGEAVAPLPATAPLDARPKPLLEPRGVPNEEHHAFPAVDAACDWFVRHQLSDGGWSPVGTSCACSAESTSDDDPPDVVGATSLALCALQSTHIDLTDRSYGDAMRAGLERLVAAQLPDGSFDPALAPHRVLDQALATRALCGVLADTRRAEKARESFREPAERSLARLLALRTPGAAWGDGSGDAQDDLRITTWATTAIVYAQHSDFDVPEAVTGDILKWLDSDPGGSGQSAAAMRTLCRVILGATQRDPHLVADHDILLAFDAEPDREGRLTNALGRYFTTAAESWWGGKAWSRRRGRSGNGAMLPLQRDDQDGCACGSWVADDADGPEGSRIGVTALTAMLFDAQYISSYANVLRAKGPVIPK